MMMMIIIFCCCYYYYYMSRIHAFSQLSPSLARISQEPWHLCAVLAESMKWGKNETRMAGWFQVSMDWFKCFFFEHTVFTPQSGFVSTFCPILNQIEQLENLKPLRIFIPRKHKIVTLEIKIWGCDFALTQLVGWIFLRLVWFPLESDHKFSNNFENKIFSGPRKAKILMSTIFMANHWTHPTEASWVFPLPTLMGASSGWCFCDMKRTNRTNKYSIVNRMIMKIRCWLK